LSEYDILTTALTDQSHVLFLEGLDDQCELEQKSCILPLAALREAVPPPRQITLLPSIPIWMLGITAWHGEIIAAIDLDAYLTQGIAQQRSDSTMLVIQQDDIMLGFFVASVRSIPTLDLEQMCAEQSIAQYPYLPVGVIVGTHTNALVLDTGIMVKDMVQSIREATVYG
jgi:chemotaxis signal transduction protein